MRRFYGLFRWIARITSVLFIVIITLFLIGEGVSFSEFSRKDLILFVFFPAGLVFGFLIAWWKEQSGGLVAIWSTILFYVFHFGFDGAWPGGYWFAVFAAPGFFFYLAGLLKPRNGLPPIRFPDE